MVPAAAGLRRQGASKGAAAAFLISTPETGVDSIAVTYALLDPIMTVFRPLAAFITAMFAGLFIDGFDRSLKDDISNVYTDTNINCSCGPGECKKPLRHKLSNGLSYAFNDLLGEIGKWFLAGVLIAGAIITFLPPEFIESNLGTGFLPMLIMLFLAVPMYVCATATTPIAAALALKGLSPGAALVFLLAGPATNVASMTVVSRILGKKATGLYLLAIIVCSIVMGLTANYVYSLMGLGVTDWISKGSSEHLGFFSYIFAVILLLLILRTLLQKYFFKRPVCDCDQKEEHKDEGHAH